MHWLYLAAAILFELLGTTAMKASDGLRKPLPAGLMFASYVLAFTSLAQSLRTLDVSVAYAIWAGLGTVIIAVIGVVWFRESLTLAKIVGIALISVGVVVLNLSGASHDGPAKGP
ncbi:MAG: multidrug efflux SMR transporter [Gemmataceae bacterium]|nr:multidrug efflux SMR transporter [Gemmataceae bacterium]